MNYKKSLIILSFPLFLCLSSYAQVERNLNDYKSLGRDSIIGCAKHELMWRYKKIGLNINCYSRIEVLAGNEDGSEALYVNFDNPIRFKELVSPDRIGINLLSGQSYYSGRGNLDIFYCNSGSSLTNDFLTCLESAQTDGNLIALPGANSPVSSYMEVVDYGDHYGFDIIFGSNSIGYRLEKSGCSLSEIRRKTVDQPEIRKSYLEELK